ncbi:multicilin isoform X1 [Melanotaenia boesemani]|uniref:multicilin isoform X1 n=1 Tax=Melanotaenia boesemani TaxID=1250792 RepID=UPI001C05A415|nr:multicilin isoform X1 [Melanotaenia boesemani]
MELMEMQRDRQRFGEVCLNQMGQHARRAAVSKTDKIPVPRSSSPVNVYVELPCIVDQAFSTIAWDDLEDCAIEVRQEKDSFGPQVNESHPDNHFFGDYTLDYLTDSTATLESSLSPVDLVPFQGCVIPPLTPQRDFSPQDSLVHSSTETSHLHAQDGASWRCKAEWHGRTLGHSTVFNKQLQETYHRQQEELDSLEERNLHLRQLASRAKHLASVLEKLMTVRNPHAGEPGTPCGDSPSLGPCKRQRLDEGYETESSDSVEDMLRDISTRCNAVLLNSTTGPKQQQESETIRMYGAFSGLQMSTLSDRSVSVDGTETGDSVLSFKTSIREHSTIRTQAFPHGHAFTSRTQQGGYRFRWVPNYN